MSKVISSEPTQEQIIRMMWELGVRVEYRDNSVDMVWKSKKLAMYSFFFEELLGHVQLRHEIDLDPKSTVDALQRMNNHACEYVDFRAKNILRQALQDRTGWFPLLDFAVFRKAAFSDLKDYVCAELGYREIKYSLSYQLLDHDVLQGFDHIFCRGKIPELSISAYAGKYTWNTHYRGKPESSHIDDWIDGSLDEFNRIQLQEVEYYGTYKT